MVHLIDAPEDPFIKNRYSMLKKQGTTGLYLGLSTQIQSNQRKLR